MKKLFFRYLYKIAGCPFSYVAGVFFIAWLWIQWFVGQRFFAGYGTSDLHHFFSAFPLASAFYLPLIVSISNIKGQYSFPYNSAIVFVSRISSCLVSCGLCLFLSLLIPAAVSIFGDIEYSQLGTGFFGILLFFTAATSFTVLIFTLIKSTAAAFVVSALCLFICNSIHNLPSYIDGGKAGSILVKTISFAWNFDDFAKGIISIRSILYFLNIAFISMGLSWYIIGKRMGNCTCEFKKSMRLVLITSVLVIFVGITTNVKFDLTRSKKFSVSAYSKNIAERISEPVSVTYYLSRQLTNLYPQVSDVKDYLESFASISDNITVKIVSPETQQLQSRLADHGINGQPIRTNSISSTVVTNVYSSIVIDYLGMTEIIPFVLDSTTLEFSLAQKIESLIEEKKNLIQIVVANDLDLENGYSYVVPYLKSLGYVPFQTELPSVASDPTKSFDNYINVPLVVLGSEKFTKTDCRVFEKFILDGGRAFLASQPYSIDINNDWSFRQSEAQQYFERMLFTFGIYCKNSLTCDVSNLRITMTSTQDTSNNSASEKNEFINYSLWPVLRPHVNLPDGMTTFWPVAFDIDNEVSEIESFETLPSLMTSQASWQMEKIDGKFFTNPFTCPKSAEDFEIKGPFTVSAEVRNLLTHDLRMVYLGDQYALSTPMISYSSGSSIDLRAFEYMGNYILELCGQNDLLALKNKSKFNYSLYKISDYQIVEAARKAVLLSLVLPEVIILLCGIMFVYSRRKFIR